MRKIKVLQLTEDLTIGGMERVIETIASSLDKKIYFSSVWTLSKWGEIADNLKRKGIDVRLVDMPSCYNPISIFKLAGLFKKEKFDIVHTHGYFAGVFNQMLDIIEKSQRDLEESNVVLEKRVKERTKELENSEGAAEKMAKTMQKGLPGAFTRKYRS